MAIILNIETSTEVCSVTVSNNENIISGRILKEGREHGKLLTVFIQQILHEASIKPAHLDAIAIGRGPGSYTGLRIGVSVAKGIAYNINKPLIAIDTLQIMASGVLQEREIKQDALLCPMIDARRMEVYTALYDCKLEQTKSVSAEIIDHTFLSELLEEKEILFFGNGANKCKNIIAHPNAVFLENVVVSAYNMPKLSLLAYNNNKFEDVAYFEPFYLKEFVTTVPSKLTTVLKK